MTIEITSPKVLVVEGKDEGLFFEALIGHLGLQAVQVLPIGGKTQLRRNLAALKLAPGFHRVVCLGVVRDANADPDGAFQSVCDALRTVDLPVPKRPMVLAGSAPQVSVMILPGEGNPGMLEDLCVSAVASDPAMLCVNGYFRCLEQQGVSLPRNIAKARVQAFLSSREEPGKRLGEAAQAGYWPWEERSFDQTRSFLQEMCWATPKAGANSSSF
ncbi:MAG: hypothetical protein HYY85_18810 [Deltaproteobacteria bacterium]|nr:hypothetical protein [Deltaproteobacteria bacterium]